MEHSNSSNNASTSPSLSTEELAASLYQAFKRSSDIMFFSDKKAVILDINEAFTRHYGYTREEAIGKTPRLLRSRHTTDEVYKRMWASILDPDKGYWRGQIINKAKDGREIPLILTITAVKDASSEIRGYVSNAVDMTEQMALQARVAQAEAMATIGEMAAVVAHEIRNPLGSIVMSAKQISSGKLDGEDIDMVRQVLQSESHRLNEALNNFLAYARPRDVKLERADLGAMAREVVNIVQSNPDLVKDIQVLARMDETLKPFLLDCDQIRQVMWNIVINAVQAMEGRGTLTVETGREGRHAYFRVKDTGPGILEASLSLIFKPFHTTKQQGTGLGLAIVNRIVKAHGGRVEIESQGGQGAVFTVFLPLMED